MLCALFLVSILGRTKYFIFLFYPFSNQQNLFHVLLFLFSLLQQSFNEFVIFYSFSVAHNENLTKKPKKKQYTVKSSDDTAFEITREQAKLFQTIENLIIDIINVGEKDSPIPLPEVTGPIFKLALEYCELYQKNGGVKPLTEDERQDESKYLNVNPWEQEFFS